MPYASSVEQWRVYSAEQSIGEVSPITVEQARQIVATTEVASWWREAFPHAVPIEVVLGGETDDEHGCISSYARSCGPLAPGGRPTQFVISLHPKMLFMSVLVHEMAHCVMPRVYGDPARIRDGWLDGGRYAGHGKFFTATQAVIAAHLMAESGGAALAEAYEFFGVPVATEAELERALAAEPAVYEAQQISDEAHGLMTASPGGGAGGDLDGPVAPAQQNRPVIPEFPWGFSLRILRRRFRGEARISQVKAATLISALFPCTARQISALENAQSKPEDPDQLTRAMLLTILCGADPIWTRYEMGLTRWDCGEITLEQARSLNREWADLVEQMNETIRQRPPRWDVPGTLE